MSHESNAWIYEAAAEHIDYWAGEGIGAVLEADIERDDLDSLTFHLKASQDQMFALEYQPNEN